MEQSVSAKNSVKSVKVIKKPYHLSTEVFKSKKDALPGFISDHKVFKQPIKLSKIFPSIGLKNFKEPCDLVRPPIDLKKENYITALITVMHNALIAARDEASNFGDRIQYLLLGEEQKNELAKLDEVYNLVLLVKGVIPQIETFNNSFERIVQTNPEGRIELRLVEDVLSSKGKKVFGKGSSLFSVFAKLREQFTANGLNFINLDQLNEFKTFNAENVPNKKYMVVFSSDGEDGAWDILTMSMRGIKSCQRWDGDYPRCLIGSVVSKFVGIIYITSGADFEGRGAKMMRRSIVRYAIDADAGKPCILVDKMYPAGAGEEIDKETQKIFIKTLSDKTKLPVYFAPSLGNKLRHFYIPFEKIREEIPERDWTYQDTPLKTDVDFKLRALTSAQNEDGMRYINAFKAKFVAQMGEYFRKIVNNDYPVDGETYRTIANIRLNSSFDHFNEGLSKYVFQRIPPPKDISDPKDRYKKYLIWLALNLKGIRQTNIGNLKSFIDTSVSRTVDHVAFSDFLFFKLIKDIIFQEIKNILK